MLEVGKQWRIGGYGLDRISFHGQNTVGGVLAAGEGGEYLALCPPATFVPS